MEEISVSASKLLPWSNIRVKFTAVFDSSIATAGGPSMATVSWGMRNRFRFGACGQLNHCARPIVSGVYAVTYRQDPQSRPKSHTVVLFGEAEDFGKQLPLMTEDLRRRCEHNGPDQSELFVFLHPMPGSTQFERDKVRSQLISEYDPSGNN
ncbi:MAG TPA: hypothetical protein V6D22_08920 [Candidatus Obscuribacterales bacterium]